MRFLLLACFCASSVAAFAEDAPPQCFDPQPCLDTPVARVKGASPQVDVPSCNLWANEQPADQKKYGGEDDPARATH